MNKVVTGNEAAAYGAMLSRPQVVTGYPITPQSRITEQLAEFCARGILKAKYVPVESEICALAYVMGAAKGGVRVFTATASHGLMLMHEHLHVAGGAGLPIVMAECNRSVGTPGGLHAELKDTLSQRDTGWMQFYCESVQEILDTVIQAYRISETVFIPAMVIITGIYLSYLSEGIDIPEQEKVDAYLPPYKPQFQEGAGGVKLVQEHLGGIGRGAMGMTYEQAKMQDKCVDAVLRANEEFEALFGRGYLPVEEYKCEDADVVVVMAGSAVGTGRYVIDRLREKGYKVGLVKIKMFRPFPKELVRKALAGRKKIAVIERDCIPGQGGVFCQEIKWALSMPGVEGPSMYGFVSGLGGADISPRLIEKAILFTIETDLPEKDIIWLGLAEKERGDKDDRNYIKIQ
jgi:pyruvate/2-oxoacid:ferredoxin oxidoreductase alpha subunit